MTNVIQKIGNVQDMTQVIAQAAVQVMALTRADAGTDPRS